MLYFDDRDLQTEVEDETGIDLHCAQAPKPKSECI